MEEFESVQDLITFIKQHCANTGRLHSDVMNDPGDGVPPIFHAHVTLNKYEFIISVVPTNLDGAE